MRVQLIASQSGNMTGLQRYAVALQKYLLESGVEVNLTSPPVLQGPIVNLMHTFGLDIATFFQSFPVSGNFGPADIYHLNSQTQASLLFFKKLHPTVVTVQDFFSYVLRDKSNLVFENRPWDRFFDSVAAKGIRGAEAVIAVSNYTKQVLVEDVGVQPERVHVIYEAVDHDVFRPLTLDNTFKAKYGLSDDFRYILYVGSEQPRKNFLLLLRAFARVHKDYPDIRLLKVGQPEIQTERLKAIQLIQDLGIENDVIFSGHVGADLAKFYNIANIFVFPSLYEGFGFPPLEAMACGSPVICSNATSLPEVTGDAALLFEPTDEDQLVAHLQHFLADENLRQTYIKLAQENAQKFQWRKTAQETIGIYEMVLGSSRL